MKSVMFSINRPHTDNIKIGAKGSELRTKPPKIIGPYKALIYETKKNGGCGKVIGEFTAFNESTYRICMGVPKHLVLTGCISVEEILAYTNNGEKDLTEITISNLVIYDKPRELSEFVVEGDCFNGNCKKCKWFDDGNNYNVEADCLLPYDFHFNKAVKPLFRPPQSWCYVESEVDTE